MLGIGTINLASRGRFYNVTDHGVVGEDDVLGAFIAGCLRALQFSPRIIIHWGWTFPGEYRMFHAYQPMSEPTKTKEWPAWRERLRHVIFDHNTPASKWFDIGLLIIILFSLAVVMLDTVPSFKKEYHGLFYFLEWIFTIIFTIEYIVRLYTARRPLRYVFSFFGIVDLLSCLPGYFILLGGDAAAYAGMVRTLRLLRVFRVLKMMRFIGEAEQLLTALRAARPKIIVFMLGVTTLVILLGTLMYVIENDPNSTTGFTSIPEGIYWAIVTMTTVGFGDVTPVTPLGKFVASMVMLLGYAIIAVPTGIVGAEIARANKAPDASGRGCPGCGVDGHADRAHFCRMCGAELGDLGK
jgi:voltage-gated potassium channel